MQNRQNPLTKYSSYLSRHNLVAASCILSLFMYWTLQLPSLSPVGPSIKSYPLILVMLLGGIPLVAEIFKNLINRNFGVDVLAAISLVTAAIQGEYLAGVLILLMLSGGQSLEQYATAKASSVLKALANRLPSLAHKKMGKKIEDIPVELISIGDTIIIYPHEISPVDGTVIEGHSSMDESFLTGEPYRVSKAPGASVLSGAINGDAVLTIRAGQKSADSRYRKIMKVMEDAEQKRPHLRRLGDQLGAIFTPIALAVALLAWYMSGDPLRFLAVLVIATPCPLLIAIPITIISTISLAAKRGIIIKNPIILERLPTCTTAIFDKTGTLTYGQPELTKIYSGADRDPQQILTLAASLERYSKHPLAAAVLKAAQTENLPLLKASEISESPGQGLVGRIDSHQVQLTHRNKILKNPDKFPGMKEELPPVTTGLECIVLIDNQYGGTLHFRDTLRPESKPFINHLRPIHNFKRILLVSGDRESEVRYLADLLGITETFWQQSPEQKLEIVWQETAKAPTLYMGDGINDAPALATATVGLAFGQPTDVTSQAAGAVFMESSLSRVDELIHLSISMRRIALQSAIGGMILSITGMGLATMGYIPPIMGALIQEAIDMIAILNALRMIWQDNLESDFYTQAT